MGGLIDDCQKRKEILYLVSLASDEVEKVSR